MSLSPPTAEADPFFAETMAKEATLVCISMLAKVRRFCLSPGNLSGACGGRRLMRRFCEDKFFSARPRTTLAKNEECLLLQFYSS